MQIKDETKSIGKFSELSRGDVFKTEGGWMYIKISPVTDQCGRSFNATCLDNGNLAILDDDDLILAIATEMVIR